MTSKLTQQPTFLKLVIQNCLEFIRYGITGVLSLVSYLVFSNLLHWMGSPIWFATTFAWVISVLVSYFGHIHFSYKVTPEHRTMSYRYFIMLSFHLIQTAALTYLFLDIFKWTYLMTTSLTVLITPLSTYPIGKYWVFKENLPSQDS